MYGWNKHIHRIYSKNINRKRAFFMKCMPSGHNKDWTTKRSWNIDSRDRAFKEQVKIHSDSLFISFLPLLTGYLFWVPFSHSILIMCECRYTSSVLLPPTSPARLSRTYSNNRGAYSRSEKIVKSEIRVKKYSGAGNLKTRKPVLEGLDPNTLFPEWRKWPWSHLFCFSPSFGLKWSCE